jgi:hypothetical protein
LLKESAKNRSPREKNGLEKLGREEEELIKEWS